MAVSGRVTQAPSGPPSGDPYTQHPWCLLQPGAPRPHPAPSGSLGPLGNVVAPVETAQVGALCWGTASRAGHVSSPEVPRPPPREGRASPAPGRPRPFPQHLGPWGRPPRSNPVCGHGPRGAVGKGDGGGRADSAERSPDVTSPPRVTKLVQLRWFFVIIIIIIIVWWDNL